MSSTPNWEHLFSPAYCTICGQDISIQNCDCQDDLSEIVEDCFDDREVDEI